MKYGIIQNIARYAAVPIVVALCAPLAIYATIASCTELIKEKYSTKIHKDKDIKISENPIFIRENYRTSRGLEERIILTE